MVLEIINRGLMVILNILRTSFFLIGTFIKSNSDTPTKFRLQPIPLILLGVSIAYILTCMFNGIKL